MDRVSLAGWTVLALSIVGYAIGTVAPYPGRSATLPGMMVGIALAVIGTESEGGSRAGSDAEAGTRAATDPASAGGEDQ